MQYLSIQGYGSFTPLAKCRELTEEDIAKISKFASWPLLYAVYYSLGKFPTSEVGSHSREHLDPQTPRELFERYVEIVDLATAAMRAEDLSFTLVDGPEGSKWNHVKPVEFVMWLEENGLPCNKELFNAVIVRAREKKIKKKHVAAILREEVPLLDTPNEIVQAFWDRAEILIEGDRLEKLKNATGLEKSRLNVGNDKRKVKIDAAYHTFWFANNGCQCNAEALIKFICQKFVAKYQPSFSEKSISEYVVEGVQKALESDEATKPRLLSPDCTTCPLHTFLNNTQN